MNRQELIEKIIQEADIEITKKDADIFLATTIDVIKKTVKKGEDVSLVGFGSFSKVKRKARTGVNPATGEKIPSVWQLLSKSGCSGIKHL